MYSSLAQAFDHASRIYDANTEAGASLLQHYSIATGRRSSNSECELGQRIFGTSKFQRGGNDVNSPNCIKNLLQMMLQNPEVNYV